MQPSKGPRGQSAIWQEQLTQVKSDCKGQFHDPKNKRGKYCYTKSAIGGALKVIPLSTAFKCYAQTALEPALQLHTHARVAKTWHESGW